MRDINYSRDTYSEYTLAMNHVVRALHRRNLEEVQRWLAIAERLLRMNTRLDEARIAEDRRAVFRIEKGLVPRRSR